MIHPSDLVKSVSSTRRPPPRLLQSQFQERSFLQGQPFQKHLLFARSIDNMAPRGETPTDSDEEEVQEAQVATVRFVTIRRQGGV